MHAHRIAQRLRALFLTLGLVVGSQALPWPHALAQSAVSETPDEQSRRAAEIYKTTMSPFCPGRTIDACPSPYATEWRDDIRQWVASGLPTDEIRRRLKARSDQDLTGAPSTVLDSVLPAVATVGSLALLGLLLRLLLRPNTAVAKPQAATQAKRKSGRPATDAELEERLEKELQQLND